MQKGITSSHRSKRASKTGSAWKKFEAEVQRILELSGYTVTQDVLISGAQTDLIGHRRIGGILTRLLVECKHSEEEQPVSGDEVENFVARMITLRNRDKFDHGYLISNVGFTRNARAAVDCSFVELLTRKNFTDVSLIFLRTLTLWP